MRIDHVQPAAPEGAETAARRFFVGLLGMVEEPKPGALRGRRGCWFRRGACAVHVGIDRPFVPQRKAHPAFAVEDAAQLAARLEVAGFRRPPG